MSLFKERSLKHYCNQFEPNEVYWRLYEEDKEISFVFNQIFFLCLMRVIKQMTYFINNRSQDLPSVSFRLP